MLRPLLVRGQRDDGDTQAVPQVGRAEGRPGLGVEDRDQVRDRDEDALALAEVGVDELPEPALVSVRFSSLHGEDELTSFWNGINSSSSSSYPLTETGLSAEATSCSDSFNGAIVTGTPRQHGVDARRLGRTFAPCEAPSHFLRPVDDAVSLNPQAREVS